MQPVVTFISGLVMACGLIISGMIDPKRVIGFLDITGHFDATLAFVMIGALMVAGIGFRFLQYKKKPVLCDKFDLPTNNKIDKRLVLGAIIFGIGWGLIGLCPGPAIVGVGLGVNQVVLFAVAMLVGMSIARQIK